MNSNTKPMVSVLTPVYNGEKYLSECIESVLSQTYDNWEYVIVNNCSTDRTLDIAQDFQSKDSRIRIHTNSDFLSLADNWNCAVKQISSESKYCKIIHADDWLFSNCLSEMVDLAEAYPTIGIVSSYVLEGNKIKGSGMPYPSSFMTGRDVCRLSLMNRIPYVFGSPTSTLIRSDLIRSRESLYNDSYFQLLDQTACYDILRESDFGFVHQVLSHSRLHSESQTSAANKLNILLLELLVFLSEYGADFLTTEELSKRFQERLSIYYLFLGRNLLRKRNKEFWDYHRNGLKKLGLPLNKFKLCKGALGALYLGVVDFFLHPKRNIRRSINRITRFK